MNTSNRGTNNGPVGYGRPPIERRFKPGQSGNPKGRPKNRKNLVAMLKDVMDKPVKIRSGSDVRNVTMFQAILEATANNAVGGNARALTTILHFVEKLRIFKYEPPEVYQRRAREAEELRQKLERHIEARIREGVEAELKRVRNQQDAELSAVAPIPDKLGCGRMSAKCQ